MAALAPALFADDIVADAAALFSRILATATPRQRDAGYMSNSGKDIKPHELLEPFSAELAALGSRMGNSGVTRAKYINSSKRFEDRVKQLTTDTAAQTTPCWRCNEVWTQTKPNCGCVKCKRNHKFDGSSLGGGTNYEPPTCLIYPVSFKIFMNAAIRSLIYRYTFPFYEVDGVVYKRDSDGVVVVDEEQTKLLIADKRSIK